MKARGRGRGGRDSIAIARAAPSHFRSKTSLEQRSPSQPPMQSTPPSVLTLTP